MDTTSSLFILHSFIWFWQSVSWQSLQKYNLSLFWPDFFGHLEHRKEENEGNFDINKIISKLPKWKFGQLYSIFILSFLGFI